MNRLLNAFAEEQATEDAIYYMGEALRKGIIELDVFLKVSTSFVFWICTYTGWGNKTSTTISS